MSGCFWEKCSNTDRCRDVGACVASLQAGGKNWGKSDEDLHQIAPADLRAKAKAEMQNPSPSAFDIQVMRERDEARDALSKALAYCDAAIHPTEQYSDERESLYRHLEKAPA